MRLMKASIAVAVLVLVQACAPTLPENGKIDKVVWLDQGWSSSERHWFHHITQGTSTFPVPYNWFVALEQPVLRLFGDPLLLIDSDYLRRFGFIPSPKTLTSSDASLREYGYSPSAKKAYDAQAVSFGENKFVGNPDGLPVGFARLTSAKNPFTGEASPDQIGLTCAACHTGHLEYNGVSLRIDGAPAMTNLGKFRKSLALALGYTKFVPFRFGRFAERVLGAEHTSEQKAALEKKFDMLLEVSALLREIKDPVLGDKDRNTEEGFTRLDALNGIGNQVFFTDLWAPKGGFADAKDNLHRITAPVNFPHVWNTPWFNWVQWDASIMQPMVRNAGEALGVSASVNLLLPGDRLYRSAVAAREIFRMEQLLAGEPPFPKGKFTGLKAPQWPEKILGPINWKWAMEGEQLYKERKDGKKLCEGCHLPPTKSPDFWSTKHWKRIANATGGQRYLKVKEIEIDYLGTDPAQAAVIFERKVKVPKHLGIDPGIICGGAPTGVVTETLFAFALGVVVEKTMDKWYKVNNVGKAERDKMNGYRPNCLQAKMKYKTRPLNGIWATAPYLHNGSVPNLYALLSPVSDRPKKFCLGHREFDPETVGYKLEEPPCPSGTFELDTQKAGNSNKGHEFNDGEGKGIIGRLLKPTERRNLVEYLKSL